MTRSTIWSVSPATLLGYFREALVAVIPVADKVRMPWREPANYDDWDTIAAAIYAGIVIRSIENSVECQHTCPLLAYDKRVDIYSNHNLISDFSLEGKNAFICLETRNSPFDTCLFAVLDEAGHVISHARLDFDDVQFTVVAEKGGRPIVLDQLQVML